MREHVHTDYKSGALSHSATGPLKLEDGKGFEPPKPHKSAVPCKETSFDHLDLPTRELSGDFRLDFWWRSAIVQFGQLIRLLVTSKG